MGIKTPKAAVAISNSFLRFASLNDIVLKVHSSLNECPISRAWILNVVCQEVVLLMLPWRIVLEVHTLAIMFPKLCTQASICNRVVFQRFFHKFIAAVGDSIDGASYSLWEAFAIAATLYVHVPQSNPPEGQSLSCQGSKLSDCVWSAYDQCPSS